MNKDTKEALIEESVRVGGSAAGAAGSVATVSAAGSVTGLSAAGITSGLSAIGSVVGGGMVAGIAITLAVPVLTGGIAYGAYRAFKNRKR